MVKEGNVLTNFVVSKERKTVLNLRAANKAISKSKMMNIILDEYFEKYPVTELEKNYIK